MSTAVYVAIGIVVVLAILIGVTVASRRRSSQLRGRFGSEYERTLQTTGSKRDTERELAGRVDRRKELNIVPLSEATRQQYLAEWQQVQAHFVDAPVQSVQQADTLVARVMNERGYPVAEFDQRAADISVDHPAVVENYRGAHAHLHEQRAGPRQHRGPAQRDDPVPSALRTAPGGGRAAGRDGPRWWARIATQPRRPRRRQRLRRRSAPTRVGPGAIDDRADDHRAGRAGRHGDATPRVRRRNRPSRRRPTPRKLLRPRHRLPRQRSPAAGHLLTPRCSVRHRTLQATTRAAAIGRREPVPRVCSGTVGHSSSAGMASRSLLWTSPGRPSSAPTPSWQRCPGACTRLCRGTSASGDRVVWRRIRVD